MKKITTDPSVRLDIYSRPNRTFEKTFNVINSDGTDYDFTGITQTLTISKYGQESLTLTEGDGITVSTGQVAFFKSHDLFTLEGNNFEYQWIWETATTKKTVANGRVISSNEVKDSFSDTDTITISLEGESVTVTVNTGSNYSAAEKAKLAGIEEGATADTFATESFQSDTQLFNKDSGDIINGYINTSGAIIPKNEGDGYKVTHPISFDGNNSVTISGMVTGSKYFRQLDTDLNVVSFGSTINTMPFTVSRTSGASYLQFTFMWAGDSDPSDTLMVNYGDTARTYESYNIDKVTKVNGVNINNSDKEVYTKDEVDEFFEGDITVILSGNSLFIRTTYSATEDLVQELELANDNNIPNIKPAKIIGNADEYTATGTAISSSTDDTAPFQYWALGSVYGNHGIQAISVTSASHGKTSSDIGSVWANDTKEYYISEIVDANTLIVMGKPYAVLNENGFSWTLGADTFTHVSGATNTTSFIKTASSIYQIKPSVRDVITTIYLDGVEISTDGTYKADKVEVHSEHNVPDPTTITPTNPFDYLGDQNMASVYSVHKYHVNGCLTMDYTINNLINHRVTNMGLIQTAKINLVGDAVTRELYIPRSLPVTVGVNTYDFSLKEDMTNNPPAIIYLTPTEMVDPLKPSDRHIQLGVNTSDEIEYAQAVGYLPYGTGKDDQRKDNSYVYYISTSNKMYPRLYYNRDSNEQVFYASAYMMYYNPQSNPELTSYYAVPFGDKWLIYIDAHQNLTKHTVVVDDFLINKEIETVDSGGDLTLITDDFIPKGGIVITVTNNYGYVVLKTL